MSYVTKRGVPIFDEHTLVGDDGKPLLKVTRKVLEETAAKCNRRIQQTRDYCPIVIGHTKDGQPEHKQPKIVGYASNFRVKPLFNTGRFAIHADFHVASNHVAEVRQYPRRSVEFWPGRKEIDPIALLGATAPERDLGLLKFSRDTSFHYSRTSPEKPMPDSVPDAPKGDIVDKLIAALEQTDIFKWAREKMKAEKGEQDAMAPEGPEGGLPPEGPEGAEGGLPPEGELPPELPPEGDENMDPAADKEPVRYEGAAPSGSNTQVPGAIKKPAKMSRQDAELLRYQRDYEAMAAENHNLRLRFQRSEREKDLIELEGEGYMFDRGEELDLVAGLDDAAYKKHLSRIRTRYQRGPVVSTATSRGPVVRNSRQGTRTRDEVNEIVKFAEQKRISFEDALRQMTGEPVV
jgi:hypothetical protein